MLRIQRAATAWQVLKRLRRCHAPTAKIKGQQLWICRQLGYLDYKRHKLLFGKLVGRL